METLNWEMFKALLRQSPELHLQFQYADGKWVDPSYHITEIKLAPVTSVDCGGVMNKWTEVIMQLWEPGAKPEERAMKVSKALSIIDLVEKILPLDADAILKIEFGNSQFDTRQMYPGDMISDGNNLIVNLHAEQTQCKAINRGGSCGTAGSEEECCAPVKPKIQLINLAADNNCCTPGSGCC